MKRLTALLLILTLSISLYVVPSAENTVDEVTKEVAFETAVHLIDMFAVTDNNITQTFQQALLKLAKEDDESFNKVMNAIAGTVDEFSCYYSKEEWEILSKELSGVICGIGVTAMIVNGYFEVTSLIDGGSAKEAGIVPGDRIIEADGVDLTGTKADVASSYITGEEGTKVTIKVLKKDGSIVIHVLDRRIVVVPSVDSAILEEENIGYIIISTFTRETANEVKKVLEDFKIKGINDVIVDLRNNGGGVMDGGMSTAALFMDKEEVIITTKGNGKDEEPKVYKTAEDGYDFNTVILINEYTASASEIMTSAMVDNGHAVTVGKKTYGKASAQDITPLSSGGALRFTTLSYYTAKGNFINKAGIEPDYDIDNTKYNYEWEEAPKLSYVNKYKIGDEGDEIESIETMLYKLGYLSKAPDKVYDEYTQNAVSVFQKGNNLFPYGVCDITTQSYLVNRFIETDFYTDNQLEFAISHLKNKNSGNN